MKPQQIVFTTIWFLLISIAWWIDVFGVPSRMTMVESAPRIAPITIPGIHDNIIHDNAIVVGTPSYYIGTPMVVATPESTPTSIPEYVYKYVYIEPTQPVPKPQETDNTLVIPRVLP